MKTLHEQILTLNSGKLAYRKPVLNRHGKVSKLTLKTGSSTDSNIPGFGAGGGGTD